MSDRESPGHGNRLCYDIDQQVEVVVMQRSMMNMMMKIMRMLASIPLMMKSCLMTTPALTPLMSPTMMCWTKMMLCDITGQHSTKCMSPCSEV